MNVQPVAVSAEKPSQVAVYLSVTDGQKSVVGLTEEDFQLYEDGKPLDPKEVNLRLLSRDTAAAHHTLILVDLGGPIEEPGARALLAQQLAPFAERLRLQQAVSVYGFDGETQLYPFANLNKIVLGETAQTSTEEQLKAITQHKQKDSSRNLNGAALAALAELEKNLQRMPAPLRIGTLVLVSRGPDLAGRVADDELEQRLSDSPFSIYALVIGKDKDARMAEAERLGKDGSVTTSMFENLDGVLSDLAEMVESDYNRYYLISYCSPSRAGKRTLLLEVRRKDVSGDEQLGSLDVDFDADGFASGCDSSRPPSFPVAQDPAEQAKLSARESDGTWFGKETRAQTSPGVPGSPNSEESAGSKPLAAPPNQSGYAD